MNPSLVYGFHMLVELLLRLCIHPRIRARMLRLLGARIGKNVRIYECRFINLKRGFRNLDIGDDVHIGTDCLIDLEGQVRIGPGTTLSPRVTIISHTDPGSFHSSPWATRFPSEALGVTIGHNCWIGTAATILSGSTIGDDIAVGASALVKGRLRESGVYVGVPARPMKRRPDSAQ
jgi:Acetyltransferase (isoleucine patch superfamily)